MGERDLRRPGSVSVSDGRRWTMHPSAARWGDPEGGPRLGDDDEEEGHGGMAHAHAWSCPAAPRSLRRSSGPCGGGCCRPAGARARARARRDPIGAGAEH